MRRGGQLFSGYALAGALAAGFGAIQLWRMPPQVRLLLRTRRVGLALGTVYGAIVIEVITVAVTPAGALPAAVLSIIASAFVVRAFLRRKGNVP